MAVEKRNASRISSKLNFCGSRIRAITSSWVLNGSSIYAPLLNLFDPHRRTALSRPPLKVVDFLDRRLELFSFSHVVGESRASLQVAELLATVPANPNRIVIHGIVRLGIEEN